jgi:hypothetical protein
MTLLQNIRQGSIWAGRLLALLLLGLLLSGSQVQFENIRDRIRRYTRPIEFDFGTWTVQALGVKLGQWGLGSEWYVSEEQRVQLVLDYFSRLSSIRELEAEVSSIYTDPSIDDPVAASQDLAAELESLRQTQESVELMVEAILQEQVASVLVELNLGVIDTIFPPVLFKISQLPMALILSPREVIRQDADIPVYPDLTLQEIVELEDSVEAEGDYSALVVPIGGLGIYPTMIMESTTLSWVAEVIVHEWVHNYLTLRPLGWNYLSSPEARTMNETAASLLGREIGRQVMLRYYPALAPPPQVVEPIPSNPPAPSEDQTPVFDFRAEMHETRLRVDELLAAGQIEEAEAYMEERRQFFWDHGYQIRRLNQAYFAFYGAYADSAGGAAGSDPVGEAMRRLWITVDSPARFLELVSPLTNFQDLLNLLETLPSAE